MDSDSELLPDYYYYYYDHHTYLTFSSNLTHDFYLIQHLISSVVGEIPCSGEAHPPPSSFFVSLVKTVDFLDFL